MRASVEKCGDGAEIPALRVPALLPFVILVPLFLVLFPGPARGSAQEPYDVLIRNGRVLDGSGNPWRRADVALQGNRIAAVGDLHGASAAREIDARGLYVVPGFVDTHSHSADGLESEGRSHARPLLAQGITTVVVNPDGGGPVDLAAQRRELEEYGLGVNAAQLVPHGSIREEVMGAADRPPTADELERMKEHVRAGMEAGAFGLSTGLFYAPASYAETEEVVALARVAGEYGGLYQSHIRDESNYSVGLMSAVDEVVEVAREAGIVGVVSHVKALGPPVWGYSLAIVRRIERARSEGIEVYADQYPYPASATGLGSALLPRWAQAGGRDSLLARLDRPEALERIRTDMSQNLDRRGGEERIQFRRFVEAPSIEGRSLAEVARERGVSPVDAALQLLRRGSPGIVSFNMHEEDVRALMRQPWTMTASDGGLPEWNVGVPHPRSYGTFPRKIRTYVLEEEVVGLEQAVRSMTLLPAAVFRMRGRGRIEEGAMADVVVFDLERLRDRATFTEPHQLAEGVVHVFVNGEPAIRDGSFTDRRPGRVLRAPGRDPSTSSLP